MIERVIIYQEENKLYVSCKSDSSNLTYTFYHSYDYDKNYTIVKQSGENWYEFTTLDRYVKCLVSDGMSDIYSNIILVDIPQNTKSNVASSNMNDNPVGLGCSLDRMIQTNVGRSRLVSLSDRINQSIKILLSSSKEEVPIVDLGLDMIQHQFDSITQESLEELESNVRLILEKYETRINLVSVNAIGNTATNAIKVRIDYTIKNTNIASSYIYDVTD